MNNEELTNELRAPQKFSGGAIFVQLDEVAVQTGITAGTTQTQAGATPVFGSFVNVATVANANDGIRLPNLEAGNVLRIRNSGANNLKIWPAVDEKCNGGTTDAADTTVLASGATRTYVCFTDGDATLFGV